MYVNETRSPCNLDPMAQATLSHKCATVDAVFAGDALLPGQLLTSSRFDLPPPCRNPTSGVGDDRHGLPCLHWAHNASSATPRSGLGSFGGRLGSLSGSRSGSRSGGGFVLWNHVSGDLALHPMAISELGSDAAACAESGWLALRRPVLWAVPRRVPPPKAMMKQPVGDRTERHLPDPKSRCTVAHRHHSRHSRGHFK